MDFVVVKLSGKHVQPPGSRHWRGLDVKPGGSRFNATRRHNRDPHAATTARLRSKTPDAAVRIPQSWPAVSANHRADANRGPAQMVRHQ
jgi:hypothetical protein